MADGSSPFPINPRSAPDTVWAAVREDYLSGLPAIEVGRRHGVGLTAMRSRAAREGDYVFSRPSPSASYVRP